MTKMTVVSKTGDEFNIFMLEEDPMKIGLQVARKGKAFHALVDLEQAKHIVKSLQKCIAEVEEFLEKNDGKIVEFSRTKTLTMAPKTE